MIKYRECTKCNRNLPLNHLYFHKDSGNKDGFKLKCKECINGSKFKFVDDTLKLLCKKCLKILPKTEEYFIINNKSGNLTSPCKECRGLKYGKKKYDKKSLIASNEQNKICSKCFRELPKDLNHFYRKSNTNDSFSHTCRECENSIFIQSVASGQKFCKKCQQVYPSTSDFFYKDTNKSDNLSTVCIKCKKEYGILNRSNRALRVKLRKKNDVEFKIINSLRNRIYHAIKGNTKAKPTTELLGCSVKYFRYHLEIRFSDKMTWDNYGKIWHIDHIIPCKFFNLSNKDEQLICFNYKNMQPMFKEENLKKQAFNSDEVIYKSSKYFALNKEIVINNKNIIINEK